METPADDANNRVVPRRRFVLWILVAALMLVAGGAAAIGYAGWRMASLRDRFFTEDAALVIAGEVCSSLRRGEEMSDAEITKTILRLHYASAINIRLDAAGEPVDRYGKRFQVSYERANGQVTVTCLSPGPDGKAGTPDDIVRTVDGP